VLALGKMGKVAGAAKVEEVLDELDPLKARALANEVDTLLWEEVFSRSGPMLT
jgi:peptide/nickel transport system substrate-binding protein